LQISLGPQQLPLLAQARRTLVTDPKLDSRRERAARNEALFREVNERIDDLAVLAPNRDELSQYVCECQNVSCAELIAMPQEDYRQVRRDPAEFVVAPGHERTELEEIVRRGEGWLVVRKLGAGADVADELADS
jgi:hypothetical protein